MWMRINVDLYKDRLKFNRQKNRMCLHLMAQMRFFMEMFTVRDLRNRTGELIREAELGHLSLVTKHGQPVFVAVPFDEVLLESGVRVSMAIQLFADHKVTLVQAARLAGLSASEMMDKLAERKIAIADYSKEELLDDLEQFN
jgi:prevent-host-death family protein